MIYLDHAAATPVTPKALAAMMPYFSEQFFNPSSPYLPAKQVRAEYLAAKDAIAHVIGARGNDLIITSGATESIQLAFTAAYAHKPTFMDTDNAELDNHTTSTATPRVLALATEHAAVLEAAKAFPHDLIAVNKHGIIDLDDLKNKLTDDVTLVSISLVNNELGTIQPFANIYPVIRAERRRRLAAGNNTPLYLHSDASQAVNLLEINVARLGVDLLTINSAKCGGPKGVGALYHSHDVPLEPLMRGGGQERGLRSGTENVPGVIGFATAITENRKHLSAHRKNCEEMARIFRNELAHPSIIAQEPLEVNSELSAATAAMIEDELPVAGSVFAPAPKFLGRRKHQIASFIPISYPGIDAERLVFKLEEKGILVSTGAACAANKGTRSHVLSAIGLTDEEIAGSLRISLGHTNTIGQMLEAARAIHEAVGEELARMKEQESDGEPCEEPAHLEEQEDGAE